MKALKDFTVAWIVQSFLALDQAVNAVLMPMFTWSVGFADETLSARAYRVSTKGRLWARILLPLIDAMFLWQTPDVQDEDGTPIRSHCHRAYLKEGWRRGLPPEYREQLQKIKEN